MPYQSTKTYGHNIGLSACFRQWRADSHCSKLHGYALAFKFVFEATELDERNWVIDFGSLKSLKERLERAFDHKTLVAKDDPNMQWFIEGAERKVIDLVLTDANGCEAFAEYAFRTACKWLIDQNEGQRVKLKSVEVMEHGANSAVYTG